MTVLRGTMTNTNAKPGNEVWLHDTIMGMEEDGHLADFCAHIGLGMPTGRESAAGETAWPLIKAHFTTVDGILDAAEASRKILSFAPYLEFLARKMDKA